MQLLLEQSLAALIAGSVPLPANYRIYAAHAAEVIPADRQDYLRIVASRPRQQIGGVGMFPVEFQLFGGGVEDEAKLASVTAAQDAAATAIYEFMQFANLPTALAILNAPLLPGILFTGWEEDVPEDGRTESQLVARLKYNVWAGPA